MMAGDDAAEVRRLRELIRDAISTLERIEAGRCVSGARSTAGAVTALRRRLERNLKPSLGNCAEPG